MKSKEARLALLLHALFYTGLSVLFYTNLSAVQSSVIGGLSQLLLAMMLFSPIVAIMAAIVPIPAMLWLAHLHLAAYLAIVIIGEFISPSNHDDSVGAMFVPLIISAVVATLIFQLLMLFLAELRWKRNDTEASYSHFAISGLFLATFLGGWMAGTVIWSLTIPPKVIDSAQEIAADKPYCIEASGREVRSLLGLNALNLRSRSFYARPLYFHSLLLVHENDKRHFYNWSYHAGRYLKISPEIVRYMTLDHSGRCKVRKDFIGHLSLL